MGGTRLLIHILVREQEKGSAQENRIAAEGRGPSTNVRKGDSNSACDSCFDLI